MTLNQFEQLTQDKKAQTVCKRGISISERKVAKYEVILYQLDGFYIEVFFHSLRKDVVIKCFDDTRLLAPYLIKIKLIGLFE